MGVFDGVKCGGKRLSLCETAHKPADLSIRAVSSDAARLIILAYKAPAPSAGRGVGWGQGRGRGGVGGGLGGM